MPLWQLCYHFVWATKHRQSLLVPEIEAQVYALIRGKAVALGATVYAVNGMEDHTHLVAAVPPSIAVARFVGQVKGVSSREFNKTGHPTITLAWQEEYAAFSFDGARLSRYLGYVNNQKQHHTANTIIPILERTEGKSGFQIREPDPLYLLPDDEWRRELALLE